MGITTDTYTPNDAEVEAFLLELEHWTPRAGTDDALAQARAEWLSSAIDTLDTTSPIYRRALQRLQSICRRAGYLPQSCYIKEGVNKAGNEPISRTASSDVWKAKLKGKMVAMKVFRTVSHTESLKMQKAYHDEVCMWKCLKHPNIVPFLGVSWEHKYSIISAWMEEGAISDFLARHPGIHRMSYIKDIVTAFEYIHSLDIVHGDLKPGNILVDAQQTACIADFGIATILKNTHSGTAVTRGTLRYMAPELFEVQDGEADDVVTPVPTMATDLYSLGVVMWELFTETTPFSNVQDYSIAPAVMQGKRPKKPEGEGMEKIGFSDDLWSAIQTLWMHEADKRTLDPLLKIVGATRTPNRPNPVDEVTKSIQNFRLAPTPKSVVCLSTITGHTGVVYAASFHPSGQTLLSGSADGTVRTWTAFTPTTPGGSGLITFPPHSKVVSAATYSNDGNFMASASEKKAFLWDAATGQKIRVLAGHSDTVQSLAWTPRSAATVYVASAASDGTARIWDAETGAAITSLRAVDGVGGALNACTFASSGSELLTGGEDGILMIWDIRSGTCTHTFKGHSLDIQAVGAASSSSRVASASLDGSLRIWDTRSTTADAVRVLDTSSPLFALAYAPDGSTLATGGKDGVVRLWDADDEAAGASELRGHDGLVRAVGWAPDSGALVSAGRDRTLRVWDVGGAAR